MTSRRLALDAGAIIQDRGRRRPVQPFELELALLTTAPSPEGGGWTELDAPGYARRRLVFGPIATGPGRTEIRNLTVADLGTVTPTKSIPLHAALFEPGGGIRFYGRISGVGREGALTFQASAIRLHFDRPTG